MEPGVSIIWKTIRFGFITMSLMDKEIRIVYG